MQVSAEENWTAETLLSVYLFPIIKADFRTINCYMQIGVKIVPTFFHNINSGKAMKSRWKQRIYKSKGKLELHTAV